MKDLTKFIQEAFVTKSNIKQAVKANKGQSTQRIAKQMENVLDCELKFEDVFETDGYGPYEYFKDGNVYDIYDITCFEDRAWGMLISHETGNIGFISADGDVPIIENGKIVFPKGIENACYSVKEWANADIKGWLINECEQ